MFTAEQARRNAEGFRAERQRVSVAYFPTLEKAADEHIERRSKYGDFGCNIYYIYQTFHEGISSEYYGLISDEILKSHLESYLISRGYKIIKTGINTYVSWEVEK